MLGKDCPIHIESGTRCAFWNVMKGGEKGSQHLLGLALDLHTPKGMGLSEFQSIADEMNPNGGVGFYRWGVHIDARGERARWDYQEAGQKHPKEKR